MLVNGSSQFACVDGPEFDAHKVNFDVLVQRNAIYREAEQKSLADYRCQLESRASWAERTPEGACATRGGVR